MLLGGAGENDDMLLGGAGENEDMLLDGAREIPQQRAPVNANAVRDEVLQQAQAQTIPIPPVAQGRRPYQLSRVSKGKCSSIECDANERSASVNPTIAADNGVNK
jgi:DNA-binding transcriptional regulator YdaS (Cro superfamily)